jgi:ribosome-binding factor A
VTRRTERLGEEIREEVAQIIAGELKDPRIGFVTVTRVDVTPDLRTARVYVGVLGNEKQRQASLTGLKQASGFMRRSLGQSLRLRHTPELVFHYDEGLEASDRVAQLLTEIGRDPAAASSSGGEDDREDE